MWTSTKWTATDTALTCGLRRNSDRKIVKYTPNKITLVSIQGSLGSNVEEKIEILKNYFDSEHVTHLSDYNFRIISAVDNVTIIPPESFKFIN